MLLTRAPLYSHPEGCFLVRLACVKPAANVRSEPGSNSPVKLLSLSKSHDFVALEKTGIDRSLKGSWLVPKSP